MNVNIQGSRCRHALALPHALQPFEFVESPEQSKGNSQFVALKHTDQLLSALESNRGWESWIKHCTLKQISTISERGGFMDRRIQFANDVLSFETPGTQPPYQIQSRGLDEK